MNHTMLILARTQEQLEQWSRTWRSSPGHELWLGITARTQEQLDEIVPALLRTPATLHFVDIKGWESEDGAKLQRWLIPSPERRYGPPSLEWVVSRTSGLVARSLRNQCVTTNVPFACDHEIDGWKWDQWPSLFRKPQNRHFKECCE